MIIYSVIDRDELVADGFRGLGDPGYRDTVSNTDRAITMPRSKQSRRSEEQVAAPTKKLGRIATERRGEIIDAFIACVRHAGFQGTTVDQVAKTAGVSRTLVFHYFGDMQSLAQAAIQQIAANAVRDLAKSVDGQSARDRQTKLIDFVVAGEHFQSLSDVMLLTELISLGGRDPKIAEILVRLYSDHIASKEIELAAAFPNADAATRRAVAYALMCIGEMHWFFASIGMGDKREQDVRLACEALLGLMKQKTR
jgi:AcrR family transcriptional regulator